MFSHIDILWFFSRIDILWFVFSYRHFVVCVLIHRHFVVCVIIKTFCGFCSHTQTFCALCSHIWIFCAVFLYIDVLRNTVLVQTVCHKNIRQKIGILLQNRTVVYPRIHQLILQLNTTQTLRSPRKCTEIPFIKRKLSRAMQTSANNSTGPTDTLKPTEI